MLQIRLQLQFLNIFLQYFQPQSKTIIQNHRSNQASTMGSGFNLIPINIQISPNN